MPKKSTRHWAKRKLTAGKNNIENCGQHLYEVSVAYEEAHPEITEQINIMLVILDETLEMIDRLEKSI